MCEILPISPSTYYNNKTRAPSIRELRDQELEREIKRIYEDNQCVYGARKIYRQLKREGNKVARCTVERLLRKMGISGINRGKKKRTTFSTNTPFSKDLVKREFKVTDPIVSGCPILPMYVLTRVLSTWPS